MISHMGSASSLPVDEALREHFADDTADGLVRAVKAVLPRSRPRLALSEALRVGGSLAEDLVRVKSWLLEDEPCIVIIYISDAFSHPERTNEIRWVIISWLPVATPAVLRRRWSAVERSVRHEFEELSFGELRARDLREVTPQALLAAWRLERDSDDVSTMCLSPCPSEYDIFSDSEAAASPTTCPCPSEYDNFSDSEDAGRDAEPAAEEEIVAADRYAEPAAEEEIVAADEYVFRPRIRATFPCGRTCIVQYSLCQALPREGMPPRVRWSNPMDDVEMRSILGKNMGWQGELPPTRERLFRPMPDDPWLEPLVVMAQVPISKLPVSTWDLVYDAEVTQQGGLLVALARELFTGW